MDEEELSFFANFKGWQCVKKLEVDENTTPQEIVAKLASIVMSAGNKAFDLSGIDTAAIKAYSEGLTKGKRKSYNNLAEVFASLKPTEVKAKLLPMCKEEKVYPIAEAYLINCIFSNLQLYPWIDLAVFGSIYPEVKISKPKGRVAGAKKKQ